jgi:hypothetical protein
MIERESLPLDCLELTVHQAQKWLHRLGYRLKGVLLEARAQDVARLRQG